MLFSQRNILIPKCKVAKHILFPKISYGNISTKLSHNVIRFYASSIFVTYNKHNATLYYMLKDVIFFYNTRTSYIRSLVPLYDYKSGKYSFWEVGLDYKESKAITGSWYCVKAPNGNVYVVYEAWDLSNRNELRVYNLSKDKTLYSVAYRKASLSASRLDGNPDKFSYILANSFVVICKIEDSNIYIYLVDLVSEKVDKFNYTLYDYLKALLGVLSSETDRERINEMLLSKDFKSLIDNYQFPIWDFDLVECIVDNHDKSVPFIKFLKLHFHINEIEAVYGRVNNALLVSFSFENNELSVQFTTEIGGVIKKSSIPAFTVNIPSNIVLLSKKYNLDFSYDISKSYPYYIYKVTQNYIFTRRYVFKQSPLEKHEYVLSLELSDLYREHTLYTIDGINIFKTKSSIMAHMDDNYLEQKLGVHITELDLHINPKSIAFIDLNKVKQLLRKEKYVDVSNHVFHVNVRDKIINAMGVRMEELRSIESRIFYHLILDTKVGLLYVLVNLLPEDDDNNDGEYWLFKCNIRSQASFCEVVTRKQFLKSKTIKHFTNIAKSDIHLLEVMNKSIYDDKSSYSINGRTYIYNGGLLVINNISRIKFKDIRQNRTNTLKYEGKIPKIKSIRRNYHTYQNNFLGLHNFIKTLSGDLISLYYPLIFTDLKLISFIRIRRAVRY
jgi:hypothetical protein